MNEKILNRVVSNLERLSKTAMEYATNSGDPEVEMEGRFYLALATKVKNAGSDVGEMVPGERQDRPFETYVGPGGYVMSYDPAKRGKGHRVVQQFTLGGELVAEFPSSVAAAEATGAKPGTISQVASGRIAMTRGMVFRYKRY